MGALRSSWVARGIVGAEAGVLLLGLIVSLVPVEAKTLAFWGSLRSWNSQAPDRILIDMVDPSSPLGKAGFKDHDQVVAIDGKPVDGLESWNRTVDRLQQGQEAKLTVKRDDEERTIMLKGVESHVEGMMYYHWQIAFAIGSVFYLAMLIFTRSLSPKASMWRPMMLIMVGLCVAAVLLFADLHSRYMMFDLTEAINLHVPVWQKYACIAVTFVLVGLAVWELRSKVSSSASYDQYAE